jgi:uncharacterized protein (TIGR02145 family)
MACRASTIIFIINISMAGTVYDVDGNAYQTVQIGEQIWMAENLKTTHYKNGDAIQTGYDGIAWDGLTTGAYAVYNDDESNAAIYGYLYNWYAVDDSREVCPDGWHVPTDDEYKELEIYLGMSELEANSFDWLFRGTNEGSKLAGIAGLWNNSSLVNNSEFGSSGFTALPAGFRDDDNGGYYSMGSASAFWSSTEVSGNKVWQRVIFSGNLGVGRGNDFMVQGLSVRCMSDSGPVDCEEGAIPNCNPDYEGDNVQECCAEDWVGDGYPDCSNQQYGCDLTCYGKDDEGNIIESENGNDGNDCVAEMINVEIKNVNPTAINDSTGFVKVLLSTNKIIYYSQFQFEGISIIAAFYNHNASDTTLINVIDSTSTIYSDGSHLIEIGESIITIIIKDFNLNNDVCINSSNSFMSDASNQEYMVNWDECYIIKQGCMDISACNYDEFANYQQENSCSYIWDCNGDCGGLLLSNGVYECFGTTSDVSENQCINLDGYWVQLGNDACGVCGGDNSTCTDCYGMLDGGAFIDSCGDCVGGSTGLGPCWIQFDCNEVQNGTAFINECNDCVMVGDNACVQGCDGNWKNDGTHFVDDSCGICGGDNSSCQGCTTSNACNYSSTAIIDDGSCIFPQGCNNWCEGDIESLKEIDCNGDCGGGAEYDACGVCGGETQNEDDCENSCSEGVIIDCAGICGGNAVLDNCGVCAGDGSTCLCQQDTTMNNNIYCKTDIEVLQQFINNSSRFGSNQDHTLNLELDDNENGMIEVLELGAIEWVLDNEGIKRIGLWKCENCGLMGEIPADINKLKYLRSLKLPDNNLSGGIPSTLGSMINLGVIDLSNNYFNQLPNSIVNLLRSQYSNNSNNALNLIDYVTEILSQNSLCTPLSKTMKEYLDLDVNSDYNFENQSCNPEIHILYPNDGTIRYTNDTAIPIEVLVTNYLVGEDINFAGIVDGHLHYIVDGEINEFYNSGVMNGMEFKFSFGIWGHSFDNHNIKLWLVDNNHEIYELAESNEVSYTISHGRSGCTEFTACNFDVMASEDNGSCQYQVDGCCLDLCGDCDGENDCIPQLVAISSSPESVIPIHSVNPPLIEIEFTTALSDNSHSGIEINSDYSANGNIIVEGDKIKIELYNLTAGESINFNLIGENIRSIDGDEFQLNKLYPDSTWSYNVGFLGDYNNSAYEEEGIALDSDDISTLISNWGTENYQYELGPCQDGSPCRPQDVPYLNPAFDGQWDIEDLMAFVLMWNWSSDNMGRVNKQMVEYGLPPIMDIIDNQIIMNVSIYTEPIHHIWFEVNTEESTLLFESINYGALFDFTLKREFEDGKIKERNLISLKGSHELSQVILGNIEAQTKVDQKLEIKYKISTKNGIISSGSRVLAFSPIPNDFELSPAFPNPFNPITTVNYALPEESNIVLSVYDIQGRLVTYLKNELKSAGYHEAIWDATQHASGMYFIRLNGYNSEHRLQFSKMQKIILVK